MSTALKITALVNALLALGHGAKGLEMFGQAQKHYRALPKQAAVPYRTGWYQGCALFSILAMLNYRWSTTGLNHSIDKPIAALASATYLLSAYTYRTVDDPAQWATLVAGCMQAYAAFVA
ncbi:hypothetical protein ABW20_dc0100700 [Dactylellina cionopaga]|nr:hypothetical protein ABW20_dc0100700 [Dactylellina cionopaga]